MRLGSAAAYTPALLACFAISFVVHIATVTLSTLLPFQVVDLGGSKNLFAHRLSRLEVIP